MTIRFNTEHLDQHESEITELIERIGEGLNNVLEIGTLRGGTASIWAQVSTGKVLTIDREKTALRGLSGLPCEHRIRQIIAVSQSDEAENQVSELLAGEGVDLLFIDGSHAYEDVKADFERYSKFVDHGRWIALHDIVTEPCGVPKFWEEIKAGFESYEIVLRRQPKDRQRSVRSEHSQRQGGIGLIRKPGL